MPQLTAGDVARIAQGTVLGDASAAASGVSVDSRTIARGEAFVAIRGGHAYAAEVVAAGAPFAVVTEREALPPGATGVLVGDTVKALAALADDTRSRLDVRVVAITGSTGKTLTKDLTAAACGAGFRVHAAPRSYNTDVTVPLVVLGTPADAQVVVAELGARHGGEIGELTRLVRPEIGIITGIGLTHLGEFGSRDAIARTKSELLAELPPDGLAIVPASDDYLHLLSDSTDARVTTVGPGGHTRWTVLGTDRKGCATAAIEIGSDRVDVKVPVAGRPLVRNAVMAVRAAVELGVDPSDAAAALASARTSSWRMEVVDVDGRTVVNDAYNANPTSVPAALRTVTEMARGRETWAVLGEMAELGPAAQREHLRVGRLASALGFARVVVVGEGAAAIAEGAGQAAMVVPDASVAADVVAGDASPDALVLVKGSRVTSLERFPQLLDERARSEGMRA